MDESFQSVAVFILIGGVVAVVVWLIHQQHKRRVAELQAFAEEMGFRFVEGMVDGGGALGCLAGMFGMHQPEQFPLMERYAAFQPFGVGHSRLCSNLLYGRIGELEWAFFDYRYTTGSGKNQTTHNYAVAGVLLPCVFQGMEIRPESFLDRIGSLVGLKDIQFEMEEFNRRFFVTCGDRKFAYDVLHPGAMEWLLARGARHWQFLGTGLVLAESGSWSVAEMRAVIEDVEEFLTLLPEYVRQDRGV